MIPNTILTDDGSEIYLHRIFQITDDYISKLPDEQDIYNVSIFRGLLQEIYLQLFRSTEPKQYNLRTVIDTGNIQLLDDLWMIYTRLCYQYKHRPTILRFSLMTGISRETFDTWRTGSVRGANRQYSDTVKKWLAECESALEDGAIEGNSIGCIFGLKANYQWRETSPVDPQLMTAQVQATPEEIAQRHQGSKRPDLPVFDE